MIVCVGIAAGETIEGELGTSAKELKDKVGDGVDAIVVNDNVDDGVEEVVGEGTFGHVNPAKVVSPTVRAGRNVSHQTYEGAFLTQLPISDIFECRDQR